MAARHLSLRDIRLSFRGGGEVARVLDVPTLDFPAGELCGVTGPSGSGKTSLLHVIGGLLRPDAGCVLWGERDLASLTRREADVWRRRDVGFVFQAFHLIPELSALHNVLLPVWFAGWSAEARRADAIALLERVGIITPNRRAGLLSRGEQQRVAIARALLPSPTLILADEPTASLDEGNGAAVADLLIQTAQAVGATLIVVAHDRVLLDRLPRVEQVTQGRIR